MGFLHEGHASLIKKCREQNDIVVVSDFVNPTQFGPTEDLEAYPRDFERDSKLCESLGTDLIFCPEPSEMYHDPHAFDLFSCFFYCFCYLHCYLLFLGQWTGIIDFEIASFLNSLSSYDSL